MNTISRITLVAVVVFFTATLSVSRPGQESPPSAGPAEDSQPIRVLTYNIRYDNPEDGINSWSHRRAAVAELLSQRYRGDLIGIQEAVLGQVQDLAADLPDHDWVGVGRDDGWQAGEFTPIFYRTARFELLQHNTFWLSEQPDMPGSISWDAAITRIVTWCKFRDRLTDLNLYFFNTHFDHLGVRAREESARLLRLKISQIAATRPVILTGDFNFPESSAAYGQLTRVDPEGLARLLDCRYLAESAHQGPTASFHGWQRLGPPESRIDYIFVNDRFRVQTHKILDDRWDDRFPSDHLPVLADVVLN